mgnify:CR=1 FL=1
MIRRQVEMDPESVLPVMEVDIKDENSFENQNDLQFCGENQIIQSSSNIADIYDFSQLEVPKKNEDINTPLNPNIKEEPRDVGTILNLGEPTISSKSNADTDVDFDDNNDNGHGIMDQTNVLHISDKMNKTKLMIMWW